MERRLLKVKAHGLFGRDAAACLVAALALCDGTLQRQQSNSSAEATGWLFHFNAHDLLCALSDEVSF